MLKTLAVDTKESSLKIAVENIKQYITRSEHNQKIIQIDVEGYPDCRFFLSPKGAAQLCAALVLACAEEHEHKPESE